MAEGLRIQQAQHLSPPIWSLSPSRRTAVIYLSIRLVVHNDIVTVFKKEKKHCLCHPPNPFTVFSENAFDGQGRQLSFFSYSESNLEEARTVSLLFFFSPHFFYPKGSGCEERSVITSAVKEVLRLWVLLCSQAFP